MNRTLLVARYCMCAAAAGACAAAISLRPPAQDIPRTVTATPGTAYLDCAVVQRDRVPEPDLLPPCSMLA